MELTGGICSWRIQLRVEDSPDFFQRFATIQFLLLEQGIGDMSTWGNQIYNQPMQNLGWYTSMLGPLAGSAGNTSATTTPGSNPWAGAVGMGLQALAAYYGGGG